MSGGIVSRSGIIACIAVGLALGILTGFAAFMYEGFI